MGNELHTMPLKCERLLSSQNYRMMAWDERGVYLQLLVEAWLEQCFIPAQAEVLRRLIGIYDDAAWERIKSNVIDTMFCRSDDGNFLYNPTQLAIYNETFETHRRRAEGGRKGGRKRGNDEPSQGEAEPKPSQSQGQTTKPKSKTKAKGNPPDSPPDESYTSKSGKAERFEEFWQVYPRKKGKKEAEKKWRAKGLDEMADELIQDVETRKREDVQWRRGYIPHGSTYINQERWRDDIEVSGQPTGNEKDFSL